MAGRRKKCWSLRVGKTGHAVTVFERRPGGALWLRWWAPANGETPGEWCYRALKHDDREIGEQTAFEVAWQLRASTLASASAKATVAEVLTAYERDVCAHQKGYGPREAKRRIALWSTVLGASRHVDTIDFPTLDRFARDRRAGAIQLEGYELGKSPSNRALGADLEFLRAALNHACHVVRPNGAKLLAENPMGQGKAGYPMPVNRQKKRPVVSYDRFQKIVATADEIDSQRLFGGFMVLVEGLGWRVSAICALRASDVDLKPSPAAPSGRVYKRAAHDKEGVCGWVPMSPAVRAGIDRIRSVNPAIGEWPLFPAPRAKVEVAQGEMPKPWTRHYARALLERAEKLAKLPKVDGGDFHPYRRKWATERKHLPLPDVAAAGGWDKEGRALKLSYQQDDETTLLAVMCEPTKLREVQASEKAGTA